MQRSNTVMRSRSWRLALVALSLACRPLRRPRNPRNNPTETRWSDAREVSALPAGELQCQDAFLKENDMRKWSSTFIIAFAFGSLSFSAQTPASPPAGLAGTWRLVSASQQMDDGTVRPDPQTGPNGKGYLIYTESGQMCAVLANPDRPQWKSEKVPLDAELRSAFEGLVAYCGTYEVNATAGYVVHHIELDRVPNLAGTDRKRHYTLSGNRLVLRPAPPLPPGVREWTVEWVRVEK
jgi:hypothetical protein